MPPWQVSTWPNTGSMIALRRAQAARPVLVRSYLAIRAFGVRAFGMRPRGAGGGSSLWRRLPSGASRPSFGRAIGTAVAPNGVLRSVPKWPVTT